MYPVFSKNRTELNIKIKRHKVVLDSGGKKKKERETEVLGVQLKVNSNSAHFTGQSVISGLLLCCHILIRHILPVGLLTGSLSTVVVVLQSPRVP